MSRLGFFPTKNYRGYRETLDPYELLGVSENTPLYQIQNKFLKKLSKPERKERTEACLAYDMIVRKQKYKKKEITIR